MLDTRKIHKADLRGQHPSCNKGKRIPCAVCGASFVSYQWWKKCCAYCYKLRHSSWSDDQVPITPVALTCPGEKKLPPPLRPVVEPIRYHKG